MKLDAKKLQSGLKLSKQPEVYSSLCRSQLGAFEKYIAGNADSPILLGCTQESPLFLELAAGEGGRDISFVNIRENAGWGKSGAKVQAKIAALIAAAAFTPEPTGLVALSSGGSCVVYGGGQQALDVVTRLSEQLNVSLILSDAEDVAVPAITAFPICSGRIVKAAGIMGKFRLRVDGYAFAAPSSKERLRFQAARDGAEIEADLVLDISGRERLFAARHGRDGYVRVDPQDRLGIAGAMFDLAHLVGEFEKPVYVSYDPSICAHSRSGQSGCNICIDACPSSAISPAGERIVQRPAVCDGCGHCSSGCPSGAISYVYPDRADLVERCRIMVSTYLGAGGANAVLLVHEEEHGQGVISAMARYGEGLDENILPMSVFSAAHLGHEAICAFFTCNVQSVVILAPLKKADELAALRGQIELANAFLQNMGFDEAMRVSLVVQDDPDYLGAALKNIAKIDHPMPKRFVASRDKRETAQLALASLNAAAPQRQEVIGLPPGSPYGMIEIDRHKCTLCLACVSACPANALADNENRPQISFTERACVQCGLCKSVCPEKAVALVPRYNFANSAISRRILREEDPMECSACGKPFGSKSAIEKVIGILEGKNPMFQNPGQLAMLRMCEDCRVIAMVRSGDSPMAMGQVPDVLTADDVLPEDD